MATFRTNYSFSGDPRSAPFVQGLNNLTAAMLGSAQDDAAIAQAGYTRSREEDQRLRNDRLRQQYAAMDQAAAAYGGLASSGADATALQTGTMGSLAPLLAFSENPVQAAEFAANNNLIGLSAGGTDDIQTGLAGTGNANIFNAVRWDDRREAEQTDLAFSESAQTARTLGSARISADAAMDRLRADPTFRAQEAVLGAQTPDALSGLDPGLLALADPNFEAVARGAVMGAPSMTEVPDWALALGDVDMDALATRQFADNNGGFMPLPESEARGGSIHRAVAEGATPQEAGAIGRREVEVREGGPGAVASALDEVDAEYFSTIARAGDAAFGNMQTLTQLSEYLSSDGVYQGFGGDIIAVAQNLGASLGIEPGDIDSTQAAASIIQRFVLSEMQSTPGVSTNQDAQRMTVANANLNNQPGANQEILGVQMDILEKQRARAGVLQTMRAENIPISRPAFEARLRSLGLLDDGEYLVGFSGTPRGVANGGNSTGDGGFSSMSDDELLRSLGVQ